MIFWYAYAALSRLVKSLFLVVALTSTNRPIDLLRVTRSV